MVALVLLIAALASNWRVIAFVRWLVFAGIGVLPLIALSKQD